MRMIIVSVNYQTDRGERSYDLEMPCEIPAAVLTQQICDALGGYTGRPVSGRALFCARLNRQLAQEETLEDAGIWNGDVLVLQ